MTAGAHSSSQHRIRADAEFTAALAAVVPEGQDDIQAQSESPFPRHEPRGRAPAPAPSGAVRAADVLLARAVWSRLVEPGDRVAGALVSALGPVAALDLITGGQIDGGQRAGGRGTSGTSGTGGTDTDDRDDGHPVHRTVRDPGTEPHGLPGAVEIRSALRRWLPRLDREASLRDLRAAADAGATLLIPESPAWPEALHDLGPHAPLALWVRGAHEELGAPGLAVVGARACTGYGSHVTAELTAAACATGVRIVSGAAYGVDAVAHRTALALGARTIAVLAGGVDRPYPAAHAALLAEIAAHGAVCSELVPGSAPTRWRFLQRNRIIAALAHAVLVTEAGVRSGSLNTAGHAAEIGRPLGAVPGPITSAASAGCHRLIEEYGAALITGDAGVRALLGAADDASEGQVSRGAGAGQDDPSHTRVLDAIPLRGSRQLHDIARIAGIAHDDVAQLLAELELLGDVTRHDAADGGVPSWSLRSRGRS